MSSLTQLLEVLKQAAGPESLKDRERGLWLSTIRGASLPQSAFGKDGIPQWLQEAESIRERVELELRTLWADLSKCSGEDVDAVPGLRAALLGYLLNQLRQGGPDKALHLGILVRLGPPREQTKLETERVDALGRLAARLPNDLLSTLVAEWSSSDTLPWNRESLLRRLDLLLLQGAPPLGQFAPYGAATLSWLVTELSGTGSLVSWLEGQPFPVRHRIAWALHSAGDTALRDTLGPRRTEALWRALLQDVEPPVWARTARAMGAAAPDSWAHTAFAHGLERKGPAANLHRHLLAGLGEWAARSPAKADPVLTALAERKNSYTFHDAASAAYGLADLYRHSHSRGEEVTLQLLRGMLPGRRLEAPVRNASVGFEWDEDRLLLLRVILESLTEVRLHQGPAGEALQSGLAYCELLLRSSLERREAHPGTFQIHRLISLCALVTNQRQIPATSELIDRMVHSWSWDSQEREEPAVHRVSPAEELVPGLLESAWESVREAAAVVTVDHDTVMYSPQKDPGALKLAQAFEVTKAALLTGELGVWVDRMWSEPGQAEGLSALLCQIRQEAVALWGAPGMRVQPEWAVGLVLDARRMSTEQRSRPDRESALWSDVCTYASQDDVRPATAAARAFQRGFGSLTQAQDSPVTRTLLCSLASQAASPLFWKRLERALPGAKTTCDGSLASAQEEISLPLKVQMPVEDPLANVLFATGAFHESKDEWPLRAALRRMQTALSCMQALPGCLHYKAPKNAAFTCALTRQGTWPETCLARSTEVKAHSRETGLSEHNRETVLEQWDDEILPLLWGARDVALELASASPSSLSSFADRALVLGHSLSTLRKRLERFWSATDGNPLSTVLCELERHTSDFSVTCRDVQERFVTHDTRWAATRLATLGQRTPEVPASASEPERRLGYWWSRRCQEDALSCRRLLSAEADGIPKSTTVRILKHGHKVYLDLHFGGEPNELPPPAETFASWEALKKIGESLLEEVGATGDRGDWPTLRQLGEQLFAQCPRNLQNALTTRPSAGWLFDYAEWCPSLPWEMICVPSGDAPQMMAFSHAVARQLRVDAYVGNKQRPLRAPGITVLLGADVAQCELEVQALQQISELYSLPPPVVVPPTPTLDGLERVLSRLSTGILHVIAHGSQAVGRPGELWLAGGLHLNGAQMLGALGDTLPSLVFLNVCNSLLDVNRSSSVAHALLSQGCSVVGAVHRPETTAASAVARAYYQHFLAGAGAGMALLRARQEAGRTDPLSAVGYQLYGPPWMGAPSPQHTLHTGRE